MDTPAQKLLDYGNAILGSLRPGMVYVGGTDNGRWIPELLNETSGSEPHIIVTQNALADGRYIDFVNTLYNDRIRATLPVVGISNLVSFLERTEAYRRDLRRVEYGDERDPAMRAFMERTAPLNHAQNITRPIFIVAGGNDPRVPLNEAEQMARTVRKNGSPVWYLMAKDEGHGFAKKKNQDFQFYATVMFVREYLLK